MVIEILPARIRPSRTVFRLTKVETIEALKEWLMRQGQEMPTGECSVWFSRSEDRDRWATTLGVDHCDPPPPKRKDGEA